MPRSHLLAAAILLIPFAAPAQLTSQNGNQAGISIATNAPADKPLSTRVVAYTIDARLDTDRKSLDATETITYTNLTGQPLTSVPFHLYLNAFRPESTFTRETRSSKGIRDLAQENAYPSEKRGSITISHIDADTYGDLTSALRFTAPDDGNAQDHTVAEVTLPRPLAPNDSITFHLAFHDQFPLSVDRNGYKRDFIMGGQWFPKPGVFWHGAWNCHQYHADTEFFSDFATFKVTLTLRARYTVGATGVPTGELVNPAVSGQPATKTLSFYAEDIGDFAFAASPHFTVTDGIFLSSMGPVKIHVLALAAHPKAGPRYLDIMRKTMAEFDRRYGPYPYKIITVIDPEPDSEIGGMEYPTLITGDTSWYDPTYLTEITAEHEFGHQYWYGMVATNEFEDAWLDEGINSYTEGTVLSSLLGRNTSFVNRPYANGGDPAALRLEYLLHTDYDPVTRFAWKFRNTASYVSIVYGKSATLLATLAGLLGPGAEGTAIMDEALRTYFLRYRFTHPTTEDFLRTIEQVAIAHGKAFATIPSPALPSQAPIIPGEETQSAAETAAAGVPATVFPSNPPFTPTGEVDYTTAPVSNSSLRSFFQQAVYGTSILDYAIDAISTKCASGCVSTIDLHRKGDFILPVTVEVVFSDGTRLREHWNGIDRWTKFTYTRNARVVSAELDPDHVIPLDVDLFNNSYTTRANNVPARKLTNLWLSLQQLVSQLTAWLV